MLNSVPASVLDAHEDRLQRVETGITNLSVKVAELGCKQDFHHQIAQEQHQLLIQKLDSLVKTEEKHEKHLEKIEDKNKSGWTELVPVKLIKRYWFHACVAILGAMGHKSWQILHEILK